MERIKPRQLISTLRQPIVKCDRVVQQQHKQGFVPEQYVPLGQMATSNAKPTRVSWCFARCLIQLLAYLSIKY